MARLLLFASAREAAGCRSAEFHAASVGEALDAAVERFGESFAEILAFCSVLVDDATVARAAAWDTPVDDTSEIAVLPPVSGGQHHGHGDHHQGDEAEPVAVVVITVSDTSAAGQRPDESGPTVEGMVTGAGFVVVGTAVVPDERERIEAALRSWADRPGTDLVLTTGGTGLARSDVTPEATRAVIEREVPGIPEAMRAAGMRTTPYASLARQVAGQRGDTLVVNLPGSPKAARECLEAVMEVLPHAVALTRLSGRS